MPRFWDRIRGARTPQSPPSVGGPESSRTLLRDVRGALPASAAVARMAAALAPRDAAPRLVWLSAGDRITPTGLSDLWEGRWLLPTARAVATLSVGIAPDSDPDTTWEQRYLLLRVAPDLAADPEMVAAIRAGDVPARLKGTPLGGVIAGLKAAGQLPPDWLEQQWATELRRQPALPARFVDSPAAVAALAAQGVDFVAGDSHTFLEATTLPGHGAVWRTRAWDVEYHIAFGRPSPRSSPNG